MRISDWSSDVCSSDLAVLADAANRERRCIEVGYGRRREVRHERSQIADVAWRRLLDQSLVDRRNRNGRILKIGGAPSRRSEEHTSELQSLMRISYAVFCLKKKINTKDQIKNNNTNKQ